MSEEKCCCNCSHCARWRTKNGIECHCDLTDKFLCYTDVMDEDNHCKNWEKETNWDLQDAHDAEIREDERVKVFEEIEEALNVYLFDSPMMNPIMTRNEMLLFLKRLKEHCSE